MFDINTGTTTSGNSERTTSVSQPYVLLTKLARDLGMDRSHARKYVLRNGFTFLHVRTAETGNQLSLAL